MSKAGRTLLVFRPPSKREQYRNLLPPLGILGIASHLTAQGFDVEVSDHNVQSAREHDPRRFGVLGLSVNGANIRSTLDYARDAKTANPGIKVVLGGPSCMGDPEYFFQFDAVDAVCACEGEEAFAELIRDQALWTGGGVPGVWMRDGNSRPGYGGPRPFIEDLDKLPFPALDKVPIRRYDMPIGKARPVSSIVTSRGCPFRCIFCFHAMGLKWRPRSAKHTVGEIEWQVKELGVKEISIQDENFTHDIPRVREICGQILKRGLRVKLQLTNGVRVNRLDAQTLRLMRDAGVWKIGIAPETGSPEILEKIGKKVHLDRFREVVEDCRKLGISTHAFYTIGYPFETRAQIKQTADFILGLKTDFMQIARVIAYPKTPLADMVDPVEVRGFFEEEQNCFSGVPHFKNAGISDAESTCTIKSVHRRFYLNPMRILRLLTLLPWPSLLRLLVFTVKTKNI